MEKIMPFDGKAKWIWSQDGVVGWRGNPEAAYRTCYFRRSFSIPEQGGRLTIQVSADSRYILYLNGQVVCRGPAKGDLVHHFYETVILDSGLRPGRNVLSAIVVDYSSSWSRYGGTGGPVSVMTATGVFLLDGIVFDRKGSVIATLHSDKQWNTLPDRAYKQTPGMSTAGMLEDLDGEQYPWGWQEIDFDDATWENAGEMDAAVPADDTHACTELPYRLIPRMIPFLEEKDEQFKDVFQPHGVKPESVTALMQKGVPLTIPPRATASFVLDAGVLTTGFPILKIKGGKGGNIKLTYAEVWFEDGRRSARHCPQTGEIKGYHDVYRCAGHGKEHGYEPFHWRTFRYVRVDIATGPDPLTLLALKYRFTAYPFIRKAAFESSDSSHQKMLAMSDRTIRLCSHETFEDCPYYEQSQYVGDSHNMTPIAGYLFGDWLLAKQAILEFAWSRTYEGIPQTRYPSRVPSLITTQPLIWIKWLYDYWWYTGDRETLQDCFDVVTTSLKWFEKFLNRDGVLEALPYWAYVDGVLEWYVPGEGNITPGWRGVSGLFNLQYAGALKWAAELSEKFGVPAEAERYRTITKQVNASINKMCWLEKEGCYLDRPGGSEMSEITNAWAILSGAAEGERLQRIVERLATGEGLYKSTLQGRFFVFQAMSQAGAFEKAKRLFDHWEQIAATDLTTWPEHPWLPTRSYCHGWSSAPAYLFLAEILGVKPLRPGFAAIRIQPCRWGLKWARGKVPLPQGGEVEVQWSLSEDSCFRMTALWPQDVPAEIILPNGDVRQIESGGRPVELFFRAPR